MNRTDLFIKLVTEALNGVAPVYYQAYRGLESILENLPEASTEQQHALLKHLRKHHERVFCYELYHQARVLMDRHPHDFAGVRLQGELKKYEVEPMLRELWGLGVLSKEFVPDFLFHGPGDIDNQELVVEVKCASRLQFQALKEDIEKMQEFITNYHYKAGLFVSINTSPGVIRTMMADTERRQWVATALPNANKIFWIWKQNDQVVAQIRRFDQFLEDNGWADVR